MGAQVRWAHRFPDGSAAPIPRVGGARATEATVTTSPTTAKALPAGSLVVMIRAADTVWLKFGDNTVAAAANDNSELFPAGEAMREVPLINGVRATHFSVMSITGTTQVQLEEVESIETK